MVIVFPDAPTLTIPAPERLKLLPMVTVVDAAPSVFPAIDPVIVEYALALLEIVIVLRLDERLIPAPATRETLAVLPLREKSLRDCALIVITLAPV